MGQRRGATRDDPTTAETEQPAIPKNPVVRFRITAKGSKFNTLRILLKKVRLSGRSVLQTGATICIVDNADFEAVKPQLLKLGEIVA